MSNRTYAGKTFRFTVDNGVVFHNTYAPDGATLHYETVAGPGAGAQGDVVLRAAEVDPGIFMIGWTERSGTTITHVMNLNRDTVHRGACRHRESTDTLRARADCRGALPGTAAVVSRSGDAAPRG